MNIGDRVIIGENNDEGVDAGTEAIITEDYGTCTGGDGNQRQPAELYGVSIRGIEGEALFYDYEMVNLADTRIVPKKAKNILNIFKF